MTNRMMVSTIIMTTNKDEGNGNIQVVKERSRMEPNMKGLPVTDERALGHKEQV